MKITSEQQVKIDKIGKEHNLDLVVLHGSQATGKIITRHPDIDIAVYRRGGISFKEQVNLIGKFMSIFGNDVDLKTLHKKDPLFFYLALRDSILLYGDTYFYNELKAYGFHRYVDAQPLFKLRSFLLKKGIESLKRQYKTT